MPLPQLVASIKRRRRIAPQFVLPPDGAGAVFTRAGNATFIDANGLVATASANVLRTNHYVSGVRTTLTEPARTNVVLHNRDLTNVVWTATNITAAKDQVGADGVANAASSITATAPNGTILQAITLASSQRLQSARVKRLVGTGVVEMTTDNGATWTAITVTADYTRVSIPAQTLANPTVGFRIVTSGDSIAVDYVQNETGPFFTSDIETAAVAVTRNGEAPYWAYSNAPVALTAYVRGYELGAVQQSAAPVSGLFSLGISTNASLYLSNSGGGLYRAVHRRAGDVTATAVASPAFGALTELCITLSAGGAVTLQQAVNGTAASIVGPSADNALATTWGSPRLYVGSRGDVANAGAFAFTHVILANGVRSLAVMRGLAGV